ncbi:MAG: hypothetical protein C0396_07585 [Anaerolinea sp.]|nr:hypothetical protein [Anaerolinea sp.]
MELGKSFALVSLKGVSCRVKQRKPGIFRCRFLRLFLLREAFLTLTRFFMPIFLMADVKTVFRHDNKPIVPEIIISVTRKSWRNKYGCIAQNKAGDCSKMVTIALYGGRTPMPARIWYLP